MSPLRQAAENYLAMRRALGFKLEAQGRLLASFIDYLDRAGATRITTDLAVAWAKLPQDAAAVWYSIRLSAVRGFADHLHAIDPVNEVPPADVLPYRYHRTTARLYTADDIVALIRAAQTLRPPLHAATYATFIGLLSVSGLRVGEAIRLDRDHVNLDTAILTVVNSKFGKSREVALHTSTVEALRAYADRRDLLAPRTGTPSFFVSTTGTRLLPSCARRVFARLTRQAGLPPRPARGRACMRDLRHSFAVATLLDWYRAGVDVQAYLPRLSTYLGHIDPKSTYWYLQTTPELLALAAERLDQIREHQP